MGGFAIFFGFFACSGGCFGLVFLYTADFVDKTLLTGKEGVTLTADVYDNAVFCAAGRKTGTTTAGDV